MKCYWKLEKLGKDNIDSKNDNKKRKKTKNRRMQLRGRREKQKACYQQPWNKH